MTNSPFDNLRSIANKFGNPELKRDLIFRAMEIELKSPALIKKYHETLLFLLAYPENQEIFLLTNSALEKVSADYFNYKKPRRRKKLENTGIINSDLICSPSFDLLKRLNELFPGQILIHSSSATKETLSSVFKMLLPPVEHETIDKKDLDLRRRIKQFQGGNKSDEIKWLIELFLNRFAKEENLIDHFYNSLEIYVSIPLDIFSFSRTTLRSLFYSTYFQKAELEKYVDAKEILNQKIGKAIAITHEEKIFLADTSRLALIMLQRETDPSTYANEDDIEWFDMGRGFRIALFGMIPSRRLPFDSYIGYMAFKNGIPAAYGGAWIMGDGAKVGVNIFETLRGGESAWMFCQILRLYRQRYDLEKFVVEPYQYGKNNPEGINSGAFWFYYRLGFRPVDEKLKILAADEAKIISEQRGYRTSKEVLKKFTRSNLELNLSGEEILFLDTESLSVSITKHIAEKFSGNRKAAISFAKKYITQSLGLKFKKWNISEKKCFENLCLLFLLIPGIEKWKRDEKIILTKLLKSKGAEAEWNYIFLVKHNYKLLQVLLKVK